MNAARRSSPDATDAETQLAAFLAKFNSDDQRLSRAVRTAVRKRFPTANELVYDNYNFFVIGYSPTTRPSDAIVSIAARADSVSLCFIHGAALPDPKKLLQGAGTQTRFIRLESAAVLARPEVEALVAAAIARARAPLPSTGRGTLIIRSVSAKQRPRRKPAGDHIPAKARSTHPNAAAFPPGISGPALRALNGAGVRSLADLARWTEADLAALHGMGPKALGILKVALKAEGRRLRTG